MGWVTERTGRVNLERKIRNGIQRYWKHLIKSSLLFHHFLRKLLITCCWLQLDVNRSCHSWKHKAHFSRNCRSSFLTGCEKWPPQLSWYSNLLPIANHIQKRRKLSCNHQNFAASVLRDFCKVGHCCYLLQINHHHSKSNPPPATHHKITRFSCLEQPRSTTWA